ncbi:MAG: hypothetical protein INR65_14615 [Gluconacetobacter diazotrophicus]|nr:hypothetical protein [Gluconacetobacter diazotrophicus]
MTPWTVATAVLLVPTVLVLLAAGRGRVVHRIVAVQLGMTLTSFVLAVMCFAFDQSSFIDLSLALALLSFPATLLMTLFLERWL